MLCRCLYLRAGAVRAVTFHASDLMEVADFVALWERMARVTIHSVVTLKGRPTMPQPKQQAEASEV